MRRRQTLARRSPRTEALEARRMFDAAAGEVIQSVTWPTTGHTYHLLARTGWDDAEAKSIALGGHLVAVADQAEQDFLWSTFGPVTGIFWIGFTDAGHEGRYTWTTGEPPTYTNWFPGEPNNLYPAGERWANMWGDYGGKWNDLGPDSDQGFLHFAVAEVRNGPDLFATLQGVPTSLQPGDAFDLSGTLANLGSVTAGAPSRIAYFLSTDTTLDAGDRALSGDDVIPAGLAFNQSVPITANLTVPADVAPGAAYYVLAKADADDALAEADEANNVSVLGQVGVGAVLEPVTRTLRGVVRDADDLPLHGASVTAGEQTVFTDYDGKRTALDRDGVTGDFELVDALVGFNVTFGGTFSHFVPADAADGAALTAVASDLAGASFTRTVEVDELVTLDATKPDGGLEPRVPAALRPIFLIDYSTVAKDTDGTIRLHKDLRNDRYSDRITTKPHKSVVASGRYRKGVEAVTARLAALGFCESSETPLAVVPQMARNSPAERAAKLFKDVVADAPATTGKSKTTGTIDEAALASLNANPVSAGLLWTDALPPKWTIAPGTTDAYVSRSTLEKMRALAEGLPSVTEFVLTRASPAVVGTAAKTFRAGDEIEFRWIAAAATTPFWESMEGFERRDVTILGGKKLGVPDPAQLGIRWRYVQGYDQAATRSVVESVLSLGATRVMFNDPAILQDLGAVTITAGTTKSTMAAIRQDLTPGAGYDTAIFAKF